MPNDALAFLVLDMQRDFLESDGRMALMPPDAEQLIATVNACVSAAHSHGHGIVYVVNQFRRGDWQNLFRNGAAIEGTRGAEPDPRVLMLGGSPVAKRQGNAFHETDLHNRLQRAGVRDIVIMGVYAESCVRKTAVGARRLGYGVTIVSDGVQARTKRALETTLMRFQQAGIAVRPAAELSAPVEQRGNDGA